MGSHQLTFNLRLRDATASCRRSHAELFSDLGAPAGVVDHRLNVGELAFG